MTTQAPQKYSLEDARKLCRNHPIRPLISRYTGELSLEADSGSVRDPVTDKYLRQRKAFRVALFDTLQDAVDAALDWVRDMRQEITTDKDAVIAIPVAMRRQLLACVHLCEQKNLDFLAVVQAGIQSLTAQQVAQETSFTKAAQQLVALKKKEARSEIYVRELGILFDAFGKTFGRKSLNEITAEEIEEWLEERGVGPVTWNNYRRCLNILWNYGLSPRRGWVKHNVVREVRQAQHKTDEVTALTLAQAKAVLATAATDIPRLVPYLVLGMFCGLRRSEAQVARWEDIDWETNSIKAKGGKMRGATNRFVTLHPTAVDWLKPIAQAEGDICSGKYARRDDIKSLREKTFDFDSNIWRHTFGSYHSAFYHNWALTAAEMGHESIKMLMKNYRKPVAREVAAKFWALNRATVLKKEDKEEQSDAPKG